MTYILVKVDTRKIIDWPTFHSVFSEVFGFPGFYGQNIDAWIDCMTYLDDPDAGMSQIHAPMGGVVVLQLEHAKDFAQRCREMYTAIIECSAFVNFRRIDLGEEPVLALSFSN